MWHTVENWLHWRYFGKKLKRHAQQGKLHLSIYTVRTSKYYMFVTTYSVMMHYTQRPILKLGFILSTRLSDTSKLISSSSITAYSFTMCHLTSQSHSTVQFTATCEGHKLLLVH